MWVTPEPRPSTARRLRGPGAGAAGCEKVFAEQVSSVAARPQLEATLDYLRDVDVLVVTRIDRLARSVADLCAIIKRIEAKGATLRILAMNLDTSTSL